MKNNNLIKFVLPFILLTACQPNLKNNEVKKSDVNKTDINKVIDINKNTQNKKEPLQKFSTKKIEKIIKNKQESSIETIYFDLNKAILKPQFKKILDERLKFLNDNPTKKIVIEGYTDERGTFQYNIYLGTKRANAVKEYFNKFGIKNNQISIISYGKKNPAVIGHDETAYVKNRRAVIIIK
ncbi:OmpA family protein [Candidatus Tachikawaea gelatinosa]|uniref:Peptidoglycan-associated lipoprotein n=1 Tax=Candidatus Tachikawaea gelatinosa TaxID=1410383 RepID=A0A090AJ03_9ENTR|nr:OmpA family protein [Candidatus Tachikawaea gelatinosa]BAP58413.1 peptidoglycan-associated lipoprotein [Candidatus Tachikawaea gelatinosa]